MKTLSTKEAAQAIKDGKTLVIKYFADEEGNVMVDEVSLDDFDEQDIEFWLDNSAISSIVVKDAAYLFAEAKKGMALQNELCSKYRAALEDLKTQYPQGIYLFDWKNINIHDFEEEEGEDLPEVVYYDRHNSNLEGKLVGLEPNGHIRLYNDGYIVVEPSYLYPTEFLNVYYHLLAKLDYEESQGDIDVA